jgi:mono/diheme cytochrome c family protein
MIHRRYGNGAPIAIAPTKLSWAKDADRLGETREREHMKRLFIALTISAFAIGLTATAHADGAAVFKKKCSSCHGKDGKGQTKMGKKLGARDLTDAAVQDKLTDAQITEAINNGKKNDAGKKVMKGFKGKLSDAEIAELVKVVRAFKGK